MLHLTTDREAAREHKNVEPTHSKPHRLAVLHLRLFHTSARMRRFAQSLAFTEMIAPELPGDNVSAATMAESLALEVIAHGLVDVAYFGELLRLRPGQHQEILAVATEYGISLYDFPAPFDGVVVRNRIRYLFRASLTSGLLVGLLFAYFRHSPEADMLEICTATADIPRDDAAADSMLPGVDRGFKPHSLGVTPPATATAPAAAVIALSPNEADPIAIQVVSKKTGRKWYVAISSHRRASDAAREIFFKFHLKGSESKEYFSDDVFKICHEGGNKCYARNTIGEVVKDDDTIYIGHEPKTIGLDNGGTRAAVYGRGAGAGFGGRGTMLPTVRQGKASVDGPIDKDVIRRIIRSNINEVRYCYNQGLARNPNLRGSIRIDFTINGRGKVDSAAVGVTNLSDTAIAKCIAAAVRRWIFVSPDDGVSRTVVSYPFILEPP